VTASPSIAASPTVEEPFVGLTYVPEEYAECFFGRDAERSVIIGNLAATRLTVLHAESGVGKSSLLHAGVIAALRRQAFLDLREGRPPHFLPVIFSSWAEDPVGGLVSALADALAPFVHELVELPPRLADAIEAAAAAAETTVLVVLDQFEEYFLYHAQHRTESSFADQLAECVNDPDLPANFLVAVREDAHAGLGVLFKGRIANVYGNELHLDYLRRSAALEAIVRPVDHYNAQHRDRQPVRVEPELVEQVLDQVARGRIHTGDGGRGTVDAGDGTEPAVETPYLQLVMKRLWDAETAAGSRTLRLATLESLGGAKTIIGSHLDHAMELLPEHERDLAAAAFRYLVTPSGTKIALSAADLAALADVPVDDLRRVVERLAAGDARILRPVDEGGVTRYEIVHDALARPVLDWRTRYVRTREERELAAQVDEERRQKEEAQREAAEAQASEARERRRARVLRAALVLCVLAVFALLERGTASRESNRSLSIDLAARASDGASNPSLGPVAAALASVEAFKLSPTFEARSQVLSFLQDHAGAPSSILVGHVNTVNAVAFSPVRSPGLLASGSADGTIRLWRRDGREVGGPVIAGSLASVYDLAFSPDGRFVAGAYQDGIVRLWAVSTHGLRLASMLRNPNRKNGSPLAFDAVALTRSGSGFLLAAGDSSGHVGLWPLAGDGARSGAPRWLGVKSGVNALAFSPGGNLLGVGDTGGGVGYWILPAGRPEGFTLQNASVNSVAFSPDGRLLAAGADDGIHLVNVADPARPVSWKELRGHADAVLSVAWDGDGTLVSGGKDRNVLVWNVRTGQTAGPPRFQSGAIHAVAVSPDGSTIASGSDDDFVDLWPLGGRGALARVIGGGPEQLAPVQNRSESVWHVAAGPDGMLAAAAGDYGTVVWKPGAPATRSCGGAVAAFACVPHTGRSAGVAWNGDVLAAGDGDTFALWRVGARGAVTRLAGSSPAHPQSRGVYTLAFDGAGTLLASSGFPGDATVNLWQVSAGGRSLRWLASVGLRQTPSGVALSPDGSLLATIDYGGHVRLFSLRDPSRPAPLSTWTDQQGEQVFAVAFSPDGRLLATGGVGNYVTLWDLGDPRRPVPLGTLPEGNSILSLAFSADGTMLAAGDGLGNVFLWDVRSRRDLGDYLAGRYGAAADTVAFARDGSALYEGGRNDPVVAWKSVLWSSNGTTLRDAVCSLAHRNLRASEWEQLFGGTRLAGHRDRTCPQYPLP
jgi:WD40 repeat protein